MIWQLLHTHKKTKIKVLVQLRFNEMRHKQRCLSSRLVAPKHKDRSSKNTKQAFKTTFTPSVLITEYDVNYGRGQHCRQYLEAYASLCTPDI